MKMADLESTIQHNIEQSMYRQSEVITEHLVDYMQYDFLAKNGIDVSSMGRELEIQLEKEVPEITQKLTKVILDTLDEE